MSTNAYLRWFPSRRLPDTLLHHADSSSLNEQPFEKASNDKLLAFPDKRLLTDALNETQLIASLIRLAQQE